MFSHWVSYEQNSLQAKKDWTLSPVLARGLPTDWLYHLTEVNCLCQILRNKTEHKKKLLRYYLPSQCDLRGGGGHWQSLLEHERIFVQNCPALPP